MPMQLTMNTACIYAFITKMYYHYFYLRILLQQKATDWPIFCRPSTALIMPLAVKFYFVIAICNEKRNCNFFFRRISNANAIKLI